jgi:membrane protein
LDSTKAFIAELLDAWNKSRTPRLAAALSYYSLFSLVPTLFIALTVGSLFFENLNIDQRLFNQLSQVWGAETVKFVQDAMTSLANRSTSESLLGTLIGLGAILYASTGLFANLKDAINTIWEIPFSERNAPKQIVLDRLLAFLLVLGAGLLFIMSAFANLIINLVGSFIQFDLPLTIANNLLLIILAMLSFTLLYKILPDVRISWGDVWIGAAITAMLLFIAGRILGIYFSISNLATAFGAASALAVILVSVYYMAQIFLFGAVFTKVYAQRYGSKRSAEENSPRM